MSTNAAASGVREIYTTGNHRDNASYAVDGLLFLRVGCDTNGDGRGNLID